MLDFRTIQGGTTAIDNEKIDALRASLRGSLLLPADAGYDVSRTLWNGMIDRRPAAIVRAAGAADVMQAVNFAREHRLLLAVKGGGHNIAGKAACDGGLMIDLSAMKSVRVDPAAQAGARRTGRAAVGLRPRDAGIRAVHAHRHQLDHRHGRAHAGRRLRLAEPQARPDHRQPDRRRRRARFRRVRAGQRDAERRPVLGGARRRRQLRRRHLVRVPVASARARGAGRADRLSARAGEAGVRGLSQVHRRGARRDDRVAGAAQGAAAALPAGERARQRRWSSSPSAGSASRARRRSWSSRCAASASLPANTVGADALRRLADGLRPAACARGAQLLEVARLQGDERRRRAHPVRRHRHACRATSAKPSSASWAGRSIAWPSATPPTRTATSNSSSTCTPAGATPPTTASASTGRAACSTRWHRTPPVAST